MIFKIFMSILSTRSIRVAMSGWKMRPTPRSVMAKHWNNSFVGGWIEVTLRRAIRIRMLPRNAVMEKQYLQLLSQCINLHERLQKAVSSSQWRFRLPSSSPFFLLLLRDEVPYFDCFTKVFFSAITHKVFMSTYEWRLFINIPIRNVCVDSVQLCWQMFLREVRVIGSQLYYQLKRKLLRGLKKLLLKLWKPSVW